MGEGMGHKYIPLSSLLYIMRRGRGGKEESMIKPYTCQSLCARILLNTALSITLWIQLTEKQLESGARREREGKRIKKGHLTACVESMGGE